MRNIIQSSVTNPSFVLEGNKAIVSIPSLAFNYSNNAFTYRDLIRSNDTGNTLLDIENVIGKLDTRNHLQTQLNIDLFRIQFKVRKWYFTIASSEKLNIKFGYSKDLVELGWYGNVDKIGERLDLAPELNMHYYRELSFGLSYKVASWQIGARFKYLTGLANIATANESLSLYTAEDDYALTVETDFLVNTSGVSNFLKDPLQATFNFKNSGFAVDIGANWQLNQQWSISASIINMGFIRWKDDVINYETKGSYTFEGIDLQKLFEEETFSLDEVLDTIQQSFDIKENNHSYNSTTLPIIYLSGKYTLKRGSSLSALFYGEIFDGFRPAMALHYQEVFNKYISLGLSYSIKNRTYTNFGLSTVFSFWKMQCFLLTDNIAGVIVPKRSKSVNFRAGINFKIK